MDQEGINRLKEAIFLKKSTGQDANTEEEALKTLEKHAEAEQAEREALLRETEKKDGEIKARQKEMAKMKERIAALLEEWESLIFQLNQAECEAEILFNERLYLLRRQGLDVRRLHFERSIHVGSERLQWGDEGIFPLTEDLRTRLILDNRKHYSGLRDLRGRPKKVAKVEVRFDPAQYEVYKEYGIPVPASWDRLYAKYQEGARKLLVDQRARGIVG